MQSISSSKAIHSKMNFAENQGVNATLLVSVLLDISFHTIFSLHTIYVINKQNGFCILKIKKGEMLYTCIHFICQLL